MSVTQRLRDLIEDMSFCRGDVDELHNELLNLERALSLPLTESKWGTIPADEVVLLEAEQAAEVELDRSEP